MPYSTRLDDAFAFAHALHADQVRKASGIPYVSHLMAVAALVAENGGTEDQVIAALLHDGPEDQGGLETLAEIEARFGPDVAALVASLTDTFEAVKPEWRQRKERYVAHLETADPGALLVSAADKLHNARSIVADLRRDGVKTFEKFRGKRDGTLWYYGALVEVMSRRLPGPLVNELGRVVKEMERLGD